MKEQPKNPRAKRSDFEIGSDEERPCYMDTPFEIMPWEESSEFALLLTQLAEEYLPEGPSEEDKVYTIAKFMYLKTRSQKIRAAKNTIARLNPYHAAFDSRLASIGFSLALMKNPITWEEIETNLRAIGKDLAQEFREKCPQHKFDSPIKWARAMLREVKKLNAELGERPDELLMEKAAALMTPDELLGELAFEARCDAAIKQAREELQEIKAFKRRITFADRRRFTESHPMRLASRVGR